MLDIRLFREEPETVREALRKRGMETTIVDDIVAVDREYRDKLAELESFRHQRNVVNKEIGRMQDEVERAPRRVRARELSTRIAQLGRQVKDAQARLFALMAEVPNIPDATVPVGRDETDNVIIRQWPEHSCTERRSDGNR